MIDRTRAGMHQRLAIACSVLASCASPRHVEELPSLEGPVMMGSSWWIPTSPWSSGLYCGGDDDPVPSVDIDDDGHADGFALGPVVTDAHGTVTQLVCIRGEAHLIVDGRSVGKCPWLGGRNQVNTYYEDEDCNGEIDDDGADGRPNELGWTVMVSMDGPLPPIANVSLGERALRGGRVVDITADNYAELTDGFGNPIDNDRDGLVDVTAYYYHRRDVLKRHFEIDPHTGVITEDEDAAVRFAPTSPGRVPDDVGGFFALAGPAVASAAFVDAFVASTALADASVANLAIGLDRLPPGMVVRTSETLEVDGAAYAIAVELTDGLPIEVVPTAQGLLFHFAPLRSSGSISLRVDAATRSQRGWTGSAEVLLNGDPVPDGGREAEGALVVQAQFLAAHGVSLEVRFGGGG